jgi:uncharacterized protein YjeT (DUF2065 family)
MLPRASKELRLVSSLLWGSDMRRIGIALLVLGLAGFLIASSQRSGYDSVEGALKSTFSSEERSKKEGWEVLRWVGLGLAAVGVVLTVAPGRKT